MRSIRTMTIVSTFLSCAHAATPVPGLYAGGIFGGTYQHNVNGVTNTNTIIDQLSIPLSEIPSIVANKNINTTLGYKVLINGGGQLGFRFCDNFRLELEALYNNNPYNFLNINNVTIYNNSSTTAGFRLHGATTSGLGLVNIYYDFLGDGSSNVVPYIGGGGGYAYIYNVVKIFYNGELVTPNNQSIKSHNSALVGQAIIGSSYFMDDFFSIAIDFRYYTTPVQKFITNIHSTQNVQLQVYSFNVIFNGALELG